MIAHFLSCSAFSTMNFACSASCAATCFASVPTKAQGCNWDIIQWQPANADQTHPVFFNLQYHPHIYLHWKKFPYKLYQVYLPLCDQLAGIVLCHHRFQCLMNNRWQNCLIVILRKTKVYCRQAVCKWPCQNTKPNFYLSKKKKKILKTKLL